MAQEQIMKPMSIARDEFIKDITSLINNSMLPPFVIEDVLRGVYEEIKAISKKQLASDIAKYQATIEKAASKAVNVQS